MTIKCWDWEKGWKCVQVYEGHSHYVMGLAINPKDTSLFASACLDRTVKVWSVSEQCALALSSAWRAQSIVGFTVLTHV